ncbi:uncharacterized protein FOMMEDRAFT_164937 [Fomitiporia mediterranea MF3/22]|uniref:uncharacterized protein n=1 Tax=Fomitiporia mediterranea (strain MF3/22) TaxID=694068 RepID=UPI0004407278|nr:uncharacterized protein FOMMEDRAFT_164937 [Fomitiporia mediterranea MF3/22]EJD08269.1 hypothetical protein FOMMEDRAFT_164937 [Fomitiporia mediterranea MF3/22]
MAEGQNSIVAFCLGSFHKKTICQPGLGLGSDGGYRLVAATVVYRMIVCHRLAEHLSHWRRKISTQLSPSVPGETSEASVVRCRTNKQRRTERSTVPTARNVGNSIAVLDKIEASAVELCFCGGDFDLCPAGKDFGTMISSERTRVIPLSGTAARQQSTIPCRNSVHCSSAGPEFT